MNVLVLGIGNVLLTDESIGVRAVDELRRRYRFPEGVELLDGGTAGIELLRYISNRDYLIIIDAIKSGHPPGTVVRVEGADIPALFRIRITPHQLGLSDLLAAAQLTGETPKNLVLFGIEPKSMTMGLELSEEVKNGLDKLVDVVVEELRSYGCAVEPLAEETSAPRSFWEKG